MEEINLRTAETLDRAGIAVVLLDRDVQTFSQPQPVRPGGRGQLPHRLHADRAPAGIGVPAHRTLGAALFGADAWKPARKATGRAFRFHAASYKESWVRRGDPADLEFVKGITRKMPDAFVCANDWTAATFMRSLQCLGIRVPQDVRVIGVDDDDYAHMVSPPLTTIRQPSREIGAAAVRAMVERIEDRKMPPRDILLGCTLVVRESCGEQAAVCNVSRRLKR